MKICMIRESDGPGVTIRQSGDAAAWWTEHKGALPQEDFEVLLLDNKHRVIEDYLVARGGLNAAVVHPRDALRAAILANAESMILMHNHPSGDPEPSEEDLRLTARFQEAARLIGFEVIDSIVWGSPSEWVSLQERGILTTPATHKLEIVRERPKGMPENVPPYVLGGPFKMDFVLSCIHACKDINPDAVPAMLRALEEFVLQFNKLNGFEGERDVCSPYSGVITLARAAIAKAKEPVERTY